ncbi:hypothetical protein LC087_16950 [Bacillus carboniphilus]|uniref:Uncharacterized protein n=1 Tax=Bacillus carboniphilus TaxID=86663 RepID=A0ABY9JSP8_9BACI|nr:hypothetical protein [Bacillus carboniphilus]WLR42372.1 hypothetical protein LC087_16950 [Bacillus carboniphilus]
MLSVQLKPKNVSLIESVLKENQFIKKQNNYVYFHSRKQLITCKITLGRELLLTFSPSLQLEEYEMIHNIIIQLVKLMDAFYDDSNSLLGYLQKGEGAYILTNWDEWYIFLKKASLNSLEGKKVIIKDNDKDLGSGLLVDYVFHDHSPSIISCTIVEMLGERTYTGVNLKVVPTNEW